MNGNRLPYLLPWVQVNLLIRSITQTIRPPGQWKILKPELRRALEILNQMRRESWWNLSPAGCRLRAAFATVRSWLVPDASRAARLPPPRN